MRKGEMTLARTEIRMDDELRRIGEEDAAKLGLNLSEYIRLLISLRPLINVKINKKNIERMIQE